MRNVSPEEILLKLNQEKVVSFLLTYFACERLARDLHMKYIYDANRKEIAKKLKAFRGQVIDDNLVEHIASKLNIEKIKTYEAHKTSIDVILLRKIIGKNMGITAKDIDKIFLSTMSAANRRSARYLRNKITHTADKSSVEEVIRRYDELMANMNKFLNTYNNQE